MFYFKMQIFRPQKEKKKKKEKSNGTKILIKLTEHS